MGFITLDIPPGIFPDETGIAAKGRWSDCTGVRFWNGKPEVIAGYSAWVTLAAGTEVVGMHAFKPVGATTRVLYGMAASDKLYVSAANGAASDIGVAGFPNAVEAWSFDNYGSQIIACPKDGTLYTWAVGDATVTEVTQAPDRIVCALIADSRQAMALGCNEETSGTWNPRCVRWSDIEDLTDWVTAASGNAGEHILDDAGEIVWGTKLGQFILIWTTTSLFMARYLGNPGQTFDFERVAGAPGLMGPRAWATASNGVVHWLSPTGTRCSWTIGALAETQSLPDFILDSWQASTLTKTALFVNRRYNELIINYSAGSDYPDRAAGVSLIDGAWFRCSTVDPAPLAGGVVENMLFDSDDGAYLGSDGVTTYIRGHGKANAVNWSLTSGYIGLDDGDRRTFLLGIRPDFKSQDGNITFNIYMKQHPQSTPVQKGPYTLTTATLKKDFRASGMYAAIEFVGPSSGNSYARFGTPKLIASDLPGGRR
jgi:hypothetical protein